MLTIRGKRNAETPSIILCLGFIEVLVVFLGIERSEKKSLKQLEIKRDTVIKKNLKEF
jgi:hypothetical protein